MSSKVRSKMERTARELAVLDHFDDIARIQGLEYEVEEIEATSRKKIAEAKASSRLAKTAGDNAASLLRVIKLGEKEQEALRKALESVGVSEEEATKEARRWLREQLEGAGIKVVLP